MKKLAILITFILGAVYSMTALDLNAQTPDEPIYDFSFMVYGPASNETSTSTYLNDNYYRISIPDFIGLQDLDRISYNYFYDDPNINGDESVDVGADNTPYDINATYGFLSSYAVRNWSADGMDFETDGRAYSLFSQFPQTLDIEYYQNEKTIYAIDEHDTSAELNYLYVLKDAVKHQPTSSISNEDNYTLVSLDIQFSTDNYADTAYFNGYDAGHADGNLEGQQTGEYNARPADWAYSPDDNLIITSNDGSETGLGGGAYQEAYQDGLAAQDNDFGFGWLISFFGMFDAIFSIELLPNLTIGLIVGVPLAFRLTLGIIKVIRGG